MLEIYRQDGNIKSSTEIITAKWYSQANYIFPFVIPSSDREVLQTLQRLVQTVIVTKYSGIYLRRTAAPLILNELTKNCNDNRQFLVKIALESVVSSEKNAPNSIYQQIINDSRQKNARTRDLIKQDLDPFYIPNTSLSRDNLIYQKFCFTIETSTNHSLNDKENLYFRSRYGEALALLRFALYSHTSETFQGFNNNFLNFVSDKMSNFAQDYVKLIEFGRTKPKISSMIDLIREKICDAIKQSSIDSLALSFNGGKDCTVLLHAITTILRHELQKHDSQISPLFQLLMIDTRDDRLFLEQELFVKRVTIYYGCKLIRYRAKDMKIALANLQEDYPNLKGIFLGVRRSDLPPEAAEKARSTQPTDTDKGWPEFLRINPLLDWTYSDIWNYLLELDVPYCSLYNDGYSSLGTEQNTIKNSSLKLTLDDKTGVFLSKDFNRSFDYYLPAFMLRAEKTERDFRTPT